MRGRMQPETLQNFCSNHSVRSVRCHRKHIAAVCGGNDETGCQKQVADIPLELLSGGYNHRLSIRILSLPCNFGLPENLFVSIDFSEAKYLRLKHRRQ